MKHILWALALFLYCSCTPNPVKTQFSLREQQLAARQLVNRVTDGRAAEFVIKIVPEKQDGSDWYALYEADGKIGLEGNNGVSIASALKYYLTNYCGWHYSWCGEDTMLPDLLPLPEARVQKSSPYQYRYYLNYCTFNYTMSWWDEERWQKEIDWMAMNGINMPLAVTGQNSVWQRVYRRLGFSDEELESFFSGPAYFNWFWMGNLDGWGGPLPQDFMDKHEKLQKSILYTERSLGMTPILPAFTGHVPPALEQKFPDAKIRKTHWSNFPEVSILDPEEELFDRIGSMFIEEQAALYGTNHYYTADTFNENVPPTTDLDFLHDISAKVYNSMAASDPEAIWVMQGWLFYHNRSYWHDDRIQALLSGVEDDKMLILDLWAERYPIWSRTQSFYGKPWIWCMLHNYGQNITLSGNVRSITRDPNAALHDPNSGKMVGIGLTPEGIEQTPIIYAMMLENVWQDAPVELDDFLHDWVSNRYGSADENALAAWKFICETVFENEVNNGGNESIITGRPCFTLNPRSTTNTELAYEQADLERAWDLLIKSADNLAKRDGYRYDLVDVTRQVLANKASDFQQRAAACYASGDVQAFDVAAAEFLSLIDDMESLLSSRKEFLLGPWLEAAKAMGDTPEHKVLYERNARNLLTLWGNPDCRLRDYACRQWAGMMSGFYRPRWKDFFFDVRKAMEQGIEFDQKAFDERSKVNEWEWVLGQETYPCTTSTDAIERCKYIYQKYR